jgi:hypothetical protein
MTNYLLGRILHTDVITFDVKFRSASEITANSNQTLGPNGFDQATCSMQNDTRNNDFWIVTLTDGHCDTGTPTTCISDVVSTKTNRGQDWYAEDDDVDLSEHLCIPPDAIENWGNLEESYFACKVIRCEMRRPFQTEDYYDFDFVTNGDAETMDIQVGGATLIMNQSSVAVANKEFVENKRLTSIKVVKSALSGIVSTGAALGALIMATSF